MKGNVVHGASYLVQGVKMLGHPSLRLFVLIPLVINILIFGSLISLGLGYLQGLMDSLLGGIPDWLDFIEWILFNITPQDCFIKCTL